MTEGAVDWLFVSLSTSARFAILGLCFALVYYPMKYFPVAFGAYFAACAFAAVVGSEFGLLGALVASVVVGVSLFTGQYIIFDQVIIRTQHSDSAPNLLFVTSAAVFVLLEYLLQYGWIGSRRIYVSIPPELTIFCSIGVLLLAHGLVYRTKAGLHLRAQIEDERLAQDVGVNTDRFRIACAVAAGSLTGIAVLLLAASQDVRHSMGLSALLSGALCGLPAQGLNPRRILGVAIALGVVATLVTAWLPGSLDLVESLLLMGVIVWLAQIDAAKKRAL